MQSRQVIENKWQPFISVAETVWPNTLPFKVEGMSPDGSRSDETVTSFNYLDKIGEMGFVSIRIYDLVNEELQFVRNLMADNIPKQFGNYSSRGYPQTNKYQPEEIRRGSLDKHHTRIVVEGIVRTFGLMKAKPEKVDVNLPLWVRKKVPEKYHQRISDWLADVNGGDYDIHNQYIEGLLNNGLLAVRNYGTSGRRVILPMGHSLAYSTAQKAYWRIMETNTLMEYGADMVVTVGELRGKNRQMIDHRATFHVGRQIITIGCQRIPFSALSELAEREGWSTKEPT